MHAGIAGEYVGQMQHEEEQHAGAAERRLITTMLEYNNYDKLQRPINSTTGGAVEVVVAISIQALQGVVRIFVNILLISQMFYIISFHFDTWQFDIFKNILTDKH